MGTPSLTRNSRLFVGGTGWLADLSDVSNGFTVNDEPTTPGVPASGRFWIAKNLTSYDRSLNVPTVYYGEATAALAAHDSGILVAAGAGEFDAGQATWLGLPSTAPLDQVLTNNVNFIAKNPWIAGSTMAEFEFSAGNLTQALTGKFARTDTAYVVVTGTSLSRNLSLSAAGSAVSTSVIAAKTGIYALPLAGFPAGDLVGTLTCQALSGVQKVTGLIVAGPTYQLPDEV